MSDEFTPLYLRPDRVGVGGSGLRTVCGGAIERSSPGAAKGGQHLSGVGKTPSRLEGNGLGQYFGHGIADLAAKSPIAGRRPGKRPLGELAREHAVDQESEGEDVRSR